jgi:hypothetical protein
MSAPATLAIAVSGVTGNQLSTILRKMRRTYSWRAVQRRPTAQS